MRREIWLQTPTVFWLGGWIINVDFDATGQLLMIRGGAGKSLAQPTSLCHRTESIVSLERGGLFMCRIASLFLLQRLKGSVSGDARDFNNMET